MDAACELPQLLDRELRLLLRLGDQLRGVLRVVGELRLGEAERDAHRDEPLLRAVVQIALDPAPLGVGRRQDPLPRVVQRVHALAQLARATQLGRLAWEADLRHRTTQATGAGGREAHLAAASARATRSCARRACAVSRPRTSTANA